MVLTKIYQEEQLLKVYCDKVLCDKAFAFASNPKHINKESPQSIKFSLTKRLDILLTQEPEQDKECLN